MKEISAFFGTTLYKDAQGRLHREDGPAIIWPDGSKFYHIRGKRHREDGPAEEFANGTKGWLKNDKYHREDGPAIEVWDGSKEYYIDGKLHRMDGPARILYSELSREWYSERKQIYYRQLQISKVIPRLEYYINGVKYSQLEFDIITASSDSYFRQQSLKDKVIQKITKLFQLFI